MATTKKSALKAPTKTATASKAATIKSNGSAKSAAPKTKSSNKGPKPANKPEPELLEFLVDELKDIYWAEQKMVKTLPKMQKAAGSAELKDCMAAHLEETKGQVSRLEKVFGLLGEKPVAKKCDAMQGLTEEGTSIVEDTDAGTATRDVGVILALQKMEHYEIATYGTLRQLAMVLGHQDVYDLLTESLEEEKAADQKLTEVAESGINYEASQEEEEE